MAFPPRKTTHAFVLGDQACMHMGGSQQRELLRGELRSVAISDAMNQEKPNSNNLSSFWILLHCPQSE